MNGPSLAPQDVQSEQAVLGAVLLSPQVLDSVVVEAGLRPAHFYRPDHRAIFTAMLSLADRSEPIDHLTVVNELRRTSTLDQAGGAATVELLAAAPPVTGHAAAYATAIIEEARWRLWLDSSYRQQQAIADRDEDAYNAAVALNVTADTDRGEVADGAALEREFEQMLAEPDAKVMVPAPWPAINRALYGGARRGDTTVIAGWSSHGKSIVGVQWCEHIGDLGGNVCIYTNEMSRIDLASRLVAGRCDVPFPVIMRRRMTDLQRVEVRQAFRDLPIKIVQCSGWPWQDIARHMRKSRWDLCFLDLFHRLPGIKQTNDVDDAIAGMCNAAAQANCHLLVASQFNLERDKDRKRPIPTGRDLRGSGRMFTDPANVMFIHQEQQENPDTETWHPTGQGMVWLEKVRNGPPGPDSAVKVTLDPHRMRFDHGDEWRGRRHLEAAVA